MASELLMMDFEVRHRSARLAAPAVSLQYPLTLGFVRPGIKAQTA